MKRGRAIVQDEDRRRKKKKNVIQKVNPSDPESGDQSKNSSARGFYCIAPGDQRFGLLATFLKKNLKKKIVVIFSTYRSLLFHNQVLIALGIPNLSIHEKLDDAKARSTIDQFRDADRGLLLTTDAVFYGLIISPVDWILQFEPPDDVEKYKQRPGQQQGGNNRGLLFLLPQEISFLKGVRDSDSFLQCEFSDIKTGIFQSQMEKLVQKNFRIHQLSTEGYRSYFHAYASNPHKAIFNVKNLDPQASSASFGIKRPPKILV
ncbi:ATP-dependent RNA helicase DDX18 [Selaginella moellendorffii]|uniref:ATP-dependent RNA helicase DDX18 n=1 Tax=Selaginella moellendorffii TaxID=88036 RepID=UPI000D1D0211|nr:ATP-dependent RNA helicase DDX18 [Selaginella moellendorffii]|eukprot:XP_024535977.1 ATP-dependent RNA helicase DDX18 [Selaginella moellendorffii]